MKQIVSLLSLLFLLSYSTIACDCVEKPSITDNWKFADDVIIGKVISGNTLELKSEFRRNLILYTIEIIEPLKQEIYKVHEYRSFLSGGGGSCDAYFKVGKVFLIYAHKNDFFYSASICSRTNLLQSVHQNELSELRHLYQKSKELILKDRVTEPININNNEYELNLANSIILRQEKQIQLLTILSAVLLIILACVLVIKRRKKQD